jgi:hypothetical protein
MERRGSHEHGTCHRVDAHSVILIEAVWKAMVAAIAKADARK